MSSSTSQHIAILTDLGSVDPDDMFALFMLIALLKKHEFTKVHLFTTHHFSDTRAKIAQLMFNQYELDGVDVEVNIYAGHGISHNASNSDQFLKENTLWPGDIFGLPRVTSDEKQWFPNFAKPYLTNHEKELTDMVIKKGTFGDVLAQYSPTNKLTVVSLAPMHDIAKIDVRLHENMNLYCMGGAIEKEDTKQLTLERAGYNWGIAPEILEIVLKNSTNLCISSGLVRKLNMSLHEEDVAKIVKAAEKSPFGRTFIEDWKNCDRGNQLPKHKLLADPLTLYIAVMVMFDDDFIEENCDVLNVKTKVKYPKTRTNYLGFNCMDMVVNDDDFNTVLITDIKDREQIRRIIVGCIYDGVDSLKN